ncbi:hypothetical protein [Henriciella marina]|uniref:hypothetical protein n=1 Tax=Henriciella marina TaxID=453851 RepID=UPI00035D57D8|nr:hypothetical protein [Henriciella marina]
MFGLAWTDWQLWLLIAGGILLLYIGRPYLHGLFRSVFFGLAYVLRDVARRLEEGGNSVYKRYIELVAAHTAETLEQRLVSQEMKLEKRAPEIDRRTSGIVDKLETSRAELDATVEAFRAVDLDERTVETVRDKIYESNASRSKAKLTSAVADVRRAVKEELTPLRPQINALRSELKPMAENTARLRSISNELERSSKQINKDLATFEACIHPNYEDRRAAAQRQSILIPWLLSLLVMAIALTGVFLNFFLIQRPMAEIVGDDLQVMGIGLPTAAALVVIFLEAVAGIVLMDAAGITKITLISTLPRIHKRVLLYAAFAFLAAFSFFEAILAIQREVLIDIDQETTRMALGEGASEASGESAGVSLTMIAQMVLAVLIPWLLAIAAIPLETVVQNFILILRLVLHQVMIFLAFIFATLATVLKALGLFVLRVYDLLIFLPLAVERMFRRVRRPARKKAEGAA